jgi:hypothetical protein
MGKKNKKPVKNEGMESFKIICPRWIIAFGTIIWAVIVLYNYNKSQYFFYPNPFTLLVWMENIDKMFHLVSYIPGLCFL